jgi:hypothetical protein
MRVLLKIGGTWQEMVTSDTNEVALSYAFDNLENPTNYISEHSYNIKLPKCHANNLAFSQFVHFDSVIVANGYDPTDTMDCMLIDSAGEPLSVGRAYIATIDSNSYNLTYVGTLATLFSKLLNAGYDTRKHAEDSSYYLMYDWLKYTKNGTAFTQGTNAICRQLVYTSWKVGTIKDTITQILNSSSLKSDYGLGNDLYSTETMCMICSFVGWAAMSQGRLKEFSNDMWLKTVQLYNGSSTSGTRKVITNALVSSINTQEGAESVDGVGDGLIEAQAGEYRSYYQHPYIYVKRLFQIFQNEFTNITGYTLVLDSTMLANLENVVYMLPFENLENVINKSNSLTHTIGTSISFPTQDAEQSYEISGLSSQLNVATSRTFTIEKQTQLGALYSFKIRHNHTQYNTLVSYFPENAPTVTIRLYNSSNVVIATKKLAILPTNDDGTTQPQQSDWSTLANTLYTAGYNVMYINYSFSGGGVRLYQDTEEIIGTIGANIPAGDYYITYTLSFYNNIIPISSNGLRNIGTITFELSSVVTNANLNNPLRSNSPISLERIFGDMAPFNVLLQYSKLNHLLWVTDDAAKTVSVIGAATFFSQCQIAGVTDISDKVDASRDITVKPLSWDAKSIEFNFSEHEVLAPYKEKYGITYGSKRLITTNKISTQEKKLMCNNDGDTIYPSCTATEVAITIASMLAPQFGTIVYKESQPKPINVKDGKQSDLAGNFYLRKGNLNASSSSLLEGYQTYYRITDDDSLEILNNTYCWHSITDNPGIAISTMPMFSCVKTVGTMQEFPFWFAVPRELYTTEVIYDEGVSATTIYGAAWQNYIEEVYNAANKTLVVYARLTKAQFIGIKTNPLVQLRNILYVATSVEDWQEGNTICKITMRQISDLLKLTL